MDLVVPADHPLASAGEVTVPDLDGLDFIDSPPGFGNRSVTDAAFDAAGAHRRVTIEVADIGTAPAYVRHGLGVAVLPRFTVTHLADLVVVPFGGDALRWPMSLALPADRSPGAATAALARHVRETLTR
jgi:DNA-binding transcriptional LysR family regulator